ncbi:Uncharacterised protein [Serratia marcescens]|uniref:Uncharacterized protein n=1 Tax=Serratia marcescens TaxID=615 RepID=A0A379YZU6_SERMA|nr:Uncharacterised protein [Serratia marcescens]
MPPNPATVTISSINILVSLLPATFTSQSPT